MAPRQPGRGALALAAPAAADVVQADLAAPIDRYDHAVLGDALEWGALRMTLADGRRLVVTLPETHVFEDVAARLVDTDGDGAREVLVVETDLDRGAALTVYGAGGRLAATPPIGARHRWLAPVGVADMDGDGAPEILWVDRPHLARELVVGQRQGDRIVEIARLPGLTNHRIGDDRIRGGLRDCGTGVEAVLAAPGWEAALAMRLDGARLLARPLGTIAGPAGLDAELACAP
ncbi:MAG: VCBS repeat-containing protein [Rhodobacterales bacterium]|nr:VCBS repeat-containing protein [Rhodobacterales bacterium]